MDLSLHGGVIQRYWRILAVGAVLAVGLAVLSLGRPTWDGFGPGFQYRQAEVWQSNSTLLLTHAGFQEGRLRWTADPGRLAGLSDIYAKLATSDVAMKRLRRGGPIRGSVEARPFLSETRGPSPLLGIYGSSDTPAKAVALTRRATNSFVAFLEEQQAAAGIRRGNRVQAGIVRAAEPAALIQPRKKTLPVIVFLAVLSLAIGLVYVLENARRRRDASRPVRVVPEASPQPVEVVVVPEAAPEPVEVVVVPEAAPEPVEVVDDEEDETEPVTVRRWA